MSPSTAVPGLSYQSSPSPHRDQPSAPATSFVRTHSFFPSLHSLAPPGSSFHPPQSFPEDPLFDEPEDAVIYEHRSSLDLLVELEDAPHRHRSPSPNWSPSTRSSATVRPLKHKRSFTPRFLSLPRSSGTKKYKKSIELENAFQEVELGNSLVASPAQDHAMSPGSERGRQDAPPPRSLYADLEAAHSAIKCRSSQSTTRSSTPGKSLHEVQIVLGASHPVLPLPAQDPQDAAISPGAWFKPHFSRTAPNLRASVQLDEATAQLGDTNRNSLVTGWKRLSHIFAKRNSADVRSDDVDFKRGSGYLEPLDESGKHGMTRLHQYRQRKLEEMRSEEALTPRKTKVPTASTTAPTSSTWEDENLGDTSDSLSEEADNRSTKEHIADDVFVDHVPAVANLEHHDPRLSKSNADSATDAIPERFLIKASKSQAPVGRAPSIPLPLAPLPRSSPMGKAQLRDLSHPLSMAPSFDTQQLLALAQSPAKSPLRSNVQSSPNYRVLGTSSRPTSAEVENGAINVASPSQSPHSLPQVDRPPTIRHAMSLNNQRSASGLSTGSIIQSKHGALLQHSIEREMKRLKRLSSSNLDHRVTVYEDGDVYPTAVTTMSNPTEYEYPGFERQLHDDSLKELEMLSFENPNRLLLHPSSSSSHVLARSLLEEKLHRLSAVYNEPRELNSSSSHIRSLGPYAESIADGVLTNFEEDDGGDEWETLDDFAAVQGRSATSNLFNQMTSDSLADFTTLDSLRSDGKYSSPMISQDLQRTRLAPRDRYDRTRTYLLSQVNTPDPPSAIPPSQPSSVSILSQSNALGTIPFSNTSRSMPIARPHNVLHKDPTAASLGALRPKPDLNIKTSFCERTDGPMITSTTNSEDQPKRGSLRDHRNFLNRSRQQKRTPDGVSPSTEDFTPSVYRQAVVGPNGNLTGNLDGTAARYTGSSLANNSSPAENAFSSPDELSSSSARYISPFNRNDPMEIERSRYSSRTSHTPGELPTPLSAVPSAPTTLPTRAKPGFMYEQIRSHRESLKHMNGTKIAHKRVYSGPANSASPRSLEDGRVQRQAAKGHRPANSVATIAPSFVHPRPSNQLTRTSLYTSPSTFGLTQQTPFTVQKHRERIWKFTNPKSPYSKHKRRKSYPYDHQRRYGLVFLLVCCLFPPLLLLVGYGAFDGLMASMTEGQWHRVHRREKSVALAIGWAALGVVVCAGIGSIVVVSVMRHT